MRQEKILLAVSDTQIKEQLKDTLKSSGYMVYTVGDGASALRLSKSIVPGAAVVDEVLSGINGMTVSDILAGEGISPVIIMATAGTYRATGTHRDGIAYLIKPVSNYTVLETLNSLLKHERKMGVPTGKTKKPGGKPDLRRQLNAAKSYLMENEGYTEEEAHRYIQKTAMDFSISMEQAVQNIIDMYKNKKGCHKTT